MAFAPSSKTIRRSNSPAPKQLSGFGNGSTSTQLSPAHRHKEVDKYIVVLNVEDPADRGRMAKAWDVAVEQNTAVTL